MKSRPTDLESLTIRRAKVADADKVRYRVYSTPTDFIAVIAESALLAVRAAGISKPHKIVRDLPTEGVAIEAQRMANVPTPEQITMPTKRPDKPVQMKVDLARVDPNARAGLFKTMTLKDLPGGKLGSARILPPEMLNEIIDEHLKSIGAVPAAAEPAPVISPPAAVEEEAPVVPAPVPEPHMSTEEKITQMAAEVLPSEADLKQEENLSPDEVEKLLNG